MFDWEGSKETLKKLRTAGIDPVFVIIVNSIPEAIFRHPKGVLDFIKSIDTEKFLTEIYVTPIFDNLKSADAFYIERGGDIKQYTPKTFEQKFGYE